MLLLIILLILTFGAPLRLSSHSPVNHVVISEVQIGGATANDEFIELLNPTDCPLSLSGWKLIKKTSSGTEYNLVANLSGTISAHGFFLITPQMGYDGAVVADAFYSVTTNWIAANNSLLLFADQAKTTLVDKVGFTSEGKTVEAEGSPAPNPVSHGSLERVGGHDTDHNATDFTLRMLSDPQNRQSTISRPGGCAAPPIDVQPPPPSVGGEAVISIAEARGRPSGRPTLVEGTVVARPGQLSETHFYIQDNTGGIQIYSSKKNFPQLTIGNRVRVAGEISEAFNEKRLRTAEPSDIQIVGEGTTSPRREKSGQVGEDDEGQLLVISGEVTETAGDTFFINDGSGVVKILIRDETGIDKPRMQRGDYVTVVGIISQYQADYRLLPRLQSDLAVDVVVEAGTIDNQNIVRTVDRSGGEDDPVVFGEAALISPPPPAVPVRFVSQVLERPYLRSLGWMSVSLGALLLLLLPWLIWQKRNGLLRARLTKPNDSSES